ncbi:hypothetical protein REH65_14695 [Saccharopolyspora sp. ID03-671]|uniref:hypothetical protein n=1 Tax=Saccharopolyspora sp. ID03-671 TaxID=3073066 RepID=UPI00325020F3
MSGERARRWDSAPVQRRILGAARTLTALDRLLDVLPLLADDMRVETRFAVCPGSEFATNLADELRGSAANVVGWGSGEFDLAVSPSGNGPLHELDGRVLTLPHGAGHHKRVATETGVAEEISGLSRQQLVHGGEVVPTAIGVSHVDRLEDLRRQCPEAVPRAAVIGDPCFARLRASLPLREHYRRALGAGDRRLVLLASTWGPESLFARRGDLAKQLVTEFPDAQVALALHPNVWTRYERLQLETWLSTARSRGLVLLPRIRAWQAALVAADVVVSDHGSLAHYAACLGKPLLLGAFGDAEVAPKSPMALLGERAARLDPHADPRPQLEGARPVPGHAELAGLTFAEDACARLRALIYDLLDLREPSWPATPEPVEVVTP